MHPCFTQDWTRNHSFISPSSKTALIQSYCTSLLPEWWALLEFHAYIDMMFYSLSRCIESNAIAMSMKWVYRVPSIRWLVPVYSWEKNLIDGISVLSNACLLLPRDVVNAFFFLLINTLMTGKSVIPLQFVHSRKLPFLGDFSLLSILCSCFSVLPPLPSLRWTNLSTTLFSLPNLFLEVLQLRYRVQLLSHFSLILLHFPPLLVEMLRCHNLCHSVLFRFRVAVWDWQVVLLYSVFHSAYL